MPAWRSRSESYDPCDDYVAFLESDYFGGYVEDGGAALKFVVPPDDLSAAAFIERFSASAERAGFGVAKVDAAKTRVHLLEQVFFAVARQVDWDGLATVRRASSFGDRPVPPGAGRAGGTGRVGRPIPRRARGAQARRRPPAPRRVHRDYAMVQELRTAMLRLCQSQLRSGQVVDAEHTAVLDWLRGDLRQISALKSALIFRRIGRHNARHLLFSLAHWLAVNERTRAWLSCSTSAGSSRRRPGPEERSGHYYTKSALLDAYEVLRQLVDNTDEMSNCIVVIVGSPAFLS